MNLALSWNNLSESFASLTSLLTLNHSRFQLKRLLSFLKLQLFAFNSGGLGPHRYLLLGLLFLLLCWIRTRLNPRRCLVRRHRFSNVPLLGFNLFRRLYLFCSFRQRNRMLYRSFLQNRSLNLLPPLLKSPHLPLILHHNTLLKLRRQKLRLF